ncbi:MAG: DUF805 domain-containing protein [Candidatus Marinimicrobia bacterium]|nr:DUF805 domain-containing protein [Candidatus Neomarinimicrobiota bacterium]
MKWFIDAFKKYVVFSGRASRKAYWMFVLFYILFGWLAIMLDRMFGTPGVVDIDVVGGYGNGPIYGLYSLVLLLPSLAILVRRLHDIGKHGGWIFISLIPIIGWIWILVLLLREGDLMQNMYGPIPEEVS